MRAADPDGEADDPALLEGVVLALARRHVPTAQKLESVDESGRKGRAYFIDDDIVLKTQRLARLRGRVVEEFETSLEKEAFFLRQHRKDPAITTPVFLGYGREGSIEYVCMTRMEGVASRRANLTDAERQQLLRQLLAFSVVCISCLRSRSLRASSSRVTGL